MPSALRHRFARPWPLHAARRRGAGRRRRCRACVVSWIRARRSKDLQPSPDPEPEPKLVAPFFQTHISGDDHGGRLMSDASTIDIAKGGTFQLGSRRVHRMGYGAMQLAGPGVFGPPRDRDGAIAVLREAVANGVDHIDTSDFYGPHITNELIRE